LSNEFIDSLEIGTAFADRSIAVCLATVTALKPVHHLSRRKQMKSIAIKKTLSLCAAALLLSSIASGPAAAQGGAPLVASMTGAAEVPGPGDPDGSGSVRLTLNPGLGEICYEVQLSNVSTVTKFHIHKGEAGINGGPAILDLPGAPFSGFAQRCVEEVDQELIMAILQNPSGYYVNVHTSDFPTGAVRGQLSHP
jgi:hypothetical protein